MKADPKAAADAPAGPKKKKLLIIIIAVLLLAGGGGGAAWYFLHGKSKPDEHVKAVVKLSPPVFVAIESCSGKFQSEIIDQKLQTPIKLQVAGPEQVELIKLNMPKVRNRLLMLLSSKSAVEISTTEGKKKLAAEIIEQVTLPFAEKGPPQEVTDVMFTSFIIQ
jgi:flagellar FliL protein